MVMQFYFVPLNFNARNQVSDQSLREKVRKVTMLDETLKTLGPCSHLVPQHWYLKNSNFWATFSKFGNVSANLKIS